MTRDMAFSLGMLLIAGIMYFETLSFPPGSQYRAAPATFPTFLLAIIAGLSLLLLLRSIVADRARPYLSFSEIGQTLAAYWLVPTMFVLFALYVLALSHAGFVPATLVFLIVGQSMIAKRIDIPYLLRAVAVAGVATLLIYYSFSHLLRIWLP